MRVAAIGGVLAIHLFGPTAANSDIAGSSDYWIARILAIGSIWSVPVFVMLSGALTLSERAHRDGAGPFYLRRARRIIPALVFWTFVYLVVIRMFVLDEAMSGWMIVTLLVDTTVYPHLYFLWLIVGLYLAAPVLRAFLTAGGVRRAVVLAVCTLGATLGVFMLPGLLALGGVERPVVLNALTFWLAYVGYFVAGYALSVMTIGRRWVIVAAVAIPFLAALTIAQTAYPEAFHLLWAVSPAEHLGTIVAVLSICMLTVGVRLLGRVPLGPQAARFVTTLSEASFGVFLIHLVVLLVPYELLPGFHTQTSVVEAMLAYVIVFVVSFAISIGARKVPGLRMVF